MDEKSRIEKYQKAIKYFENDIKNSNNPIYISWAKEMIEVYKELSKSKDNNKQNNDTIKDNNTDSKKVTVNEEDKELIDYFDKYVYAEIIPFVLLILLPNQHEEKIAELPCLVRLVDLHRHHNQNIFSNFV